MSFGAYPVGVEVLEVEALEVEEFERLKGAPVFCRFEELEELEGEESWVEEELQLAEVENEDGGEVGEQRDVEEAERIKKEEEKLRRKEERTLEQKRKKEEERKLALEECNRPMRLRSGKEISRRA